MNKSKKYSRQFPIREYLYRRVSKTGAEPELLPSERKLAEEFGVARDTVRAAIAELAEQSYCMRIPGRKGLFTNPEHSNHDITFVGVVAHDGKEAELSHYAQGILSRMHLRIEDFNPFYQFVSLPQHFTPEEKADYLLKQKHDALLWLLPEDADAEAVKCLCSGLESFTAVVTSAHYKQLQATELPDQLVCSHEKPQFLEFARVCRNKRVENPLFLLSSRFQEELLISSFMKEGLPEPKFCHFYAEESREHFTRGDFDGLFICEDQRPETILDVLQGNAKLAAKRIFMPHGSRQKTIRMKYDLDISFMGKEECMENLDDLSQRAAQRLDSILASVEEASFPTTANKMGLPYAM